MATIITKNGSGSAVPPSLIQGELAINVDSGTLYYGSGSANAVRTITASLALTASYVTGSIFNSTNPVLSASYALTASHALNGGGGGTPGGANTTIQFNDAGTFSGSGNFTFTKATNTVRLSGSLNFTGSLLATQSYISKIDYIDYTVSPGTLAHSEGRTYWDVDRKTLQIDTDVNNFTISAGHVSVLRGRNTNSYTLTKGMVVYINGNSGQFATFTTASWENDPNSAYTIGLIAQDINANQFGYAVTDGEITGVNTNAFAPATLLYLSSSGQYTDTKPVAPNHTVRLGQVVVSSTNGILQVKIDNGYELGELHDVIDNTTTSSYGDLLVKSGSVWHNSRQLTGSYGLTGSLAISGSLTTNDGVSIVSLTASFISASSITGSLFGTASWATNALTASFVNTLNQNVTISGSLTVFTGSAIEFQVTNTGVSIGNTIGDIHNVTGSLRVSGSITGSLFGTASWATNAVTASFVPNSFAANIGNGINTTINVTHGLGTRDVHVTVYSASGDFATVYCDVFRSSSINDIRLVFANPPATNEYRVVVSK